MNERKFRCISELELTSNYKIKFGDVLTVEAYGKDLFYVKTNKGLGTIITSAELFDHFQEVSKAEDIIKESFNHHVYKDYNGEIDSEIDFQISPMHEPIETADGAWEQSSNYDFIELTQFVNETKVSSITFIDKKYETYLRELLEEEGEE